MARRKLTTGGGAKVPGPNRDIDDNMQSYHVELDVRSLGIQFQPIDRIEPSPFQVRRVFSELEIENLADSIRDTGLIHEPKGRTHPTKAGWVELMPGEMRLRALRRLIDRGEVGEILQRDSEGRWLVPIQVLDVNDERAERIVFAENDVRVDLSAWEWALAWQQRRDRRQARDLPHTIRDVAESHGKKLATVGEYLKVADTITPEVLMSGGIVSMGEPDHARMAKLSFNSLKGAARVVDANGIEAGATYLLQALHRVGDRAAGQVLSERASMKKVSVARTFQINIRQPLPDLTPKQARHYLGRMADALPVLAARAGERIPETEARRLRSVLESALESLSGRGTA